MYNDNILATLSGLDDGYLLDSSPFRYEQTICLIFLFLYYDYREVLSQVLARLGYSKLRDVYLPTFFTIVDQQSGINVRLSSINPAHYNISLLDVLCSTTAIPIAFSPGSIPSLSGTARFIDGGTGIDFVPVIPLLEARDKITRYYEKIKQSIAHTLQTVYS